MHRDDYAPDLGGGAYWADQYAAWKAAQDAQEERTRAADAIEEEEREEEEERRKRIAQLLLLS